jgi:hypothetical protein
MTINRQSAVVGVPNQADIRNCERFIDRHREILLDYLDGKALRSNDESDVTTYISNVMSEWLDRFATCVLPDPDHEERAFWFALYQLEELTECTGRPPDPYEEILMKTLIEARELLRNRQPLPEQRFVATRPNGT